jgi:hypothetical protein
LQNFLKPYTLNVCGQSAEFCKNCFRQSGHKMKSKSSLFSLCLAIFVGLGLFPSQTNAQGTSSFPCADDNRQCVLPKDGKRYKISFGAENSFFHLTAQGVGSILCSTHTFGEPRIKNDTPLKCRADVSTPVDDEQIVSTCAYGSTCSVEVAEGQYAIITLSNLFGNVSFSNYATSDFKCDFSQFFNSNEVSLNVIINGLPLKDSICTVSQPLDSFSKRSGDAQWKICGTENNQCELPSIGAYLVRYGADDRWFYREYYGQSFKCANSSLQDVAKGAQKRCEYLAIPQVKGITGNWTQLTSCDGCPSTTYSYTEGVTQGNAKTEESSWSVEVGLELETGTALTKAKTSIKTTTGGAKTISESFTKEANTTQTIECDKGALWQWTSRVDEFCLPGKDKCETVASSTIFRCTSAEDQPNEEKMVALTENEKRDWEARFPGQTAPEMRNYWDPFPSQ